MKVRRWALLRFAAVLIAAFMAPRIVMAEPPPAYDAEIAASLPSKLRQGESVNVPVRLTNRGSRTWTPDAFHLAYHWREANGKVAVWDGIRTRLPQPVPQGTTVRLSATLTAPRESGAVTLQWDVVHESVTWISAVDPTPPPLMPITVRSSTPDHAFSILRSDQVRLIRAGESQQVRMHLRNDGSQSWPHGEPISVAYHWIDDDPAKSIFEGQRTPLARAVAKGEQIEVTARVDAPTSPGIYRLQWDLVDEGRFWFEERDSTPEPAKLVLVYPEQPPAATTFVFSLLCLAITAWALFHRSPSRWIVAMAAVADLVTMAFALTLKQGAVLETAGLRYEEGALLAVVAGVGAITIVIAFAPPRFRPWIATGVNAALTLLILTDMLHLRFFGDVTSVVRLRSAGQLRELGPSIRELLVWRDAWLFADLLPSLAVAIFLRSFPADTLRKSSRAIALVLAPLLLPGILIVSRIATSEDGRLVQVFKNLFVVQDLGVFNYHAYDAFAQLRVTSFGRELEPRRVEEIENWMVETAPTRAGAGPSFGAAKGRNLVMIQVESLQNFVLDLRVDGQEVTPNLNRWKRSKAMWFSGCTDQTSQGRTSDGELTSQVSLHPIRRGSAAFRFSSNQYDSLARNLSERGYTTLSAVPFDSAFWNRAVTHPQYGYRINLFGDAFAPGTVVGWGLNDRDFLRQMLPRLSTMRKPFAALLITLSNHYPFDGFPAELRELRLGKYESTALGNYLHTVHLFDSAFGDFMTGLSEQGLLDDTVVAVWGDHTAGLPLDGSLAELTRQGQSEMDWYALDEVPLMVRVPGDSVRGEKGGPCGLTDVTPTLLALLGIDPAEHAFIGRNLLGAPGDGPVVRAYGAFLYGNLLYSPNGKAFESGRCYDYRAHQQLPVERCRQGYIEARRQQEISHDIIRYDLQRRLRERLKNRASAVRHPVTQIEAVR